MDELMAKKKEGTVEGRMTGWMEDRKDEKKEVGKAGRKEWMNGLFKRKEEGRTN